MNAPAWALLAATTLLAGADWWAVARGARRLEVVAKPAVLVGLLAVAVALDPHYDNVRAWFVAGLVCSFAGDVALLGSERWFVAGLGSFLAGHLAYVAGFSLESRSALGGVIGLVIVVGGDGLVGRRIVGAVRVGPTPDLTWPVIVYVGAISAMVVMAGASGLAAAGVGAACFYASDATLAWDRFVRRLWRGRLAVVVTYHLGQAGLILALAR